MPEQFTSPKSRFLKSDLAKRFGEMTAGSEFKQLIDVALLQFMFEDPGARDGNTAVACHFRAEGAKRFASILLNLCEREPRRKPQETDNLQETT